MPSYFVLTTPTPTALAVKAPIEIRTAFSCASLKETYKRCNLNREIDKIYNQHST